MNNKIKLIAEQAGIVIPLDSEYNGHIYRNTIEKFAELIVQECTSVCNERASTAQMGSDEQCEADDCASAIIKRFGVDK